MNTNDNRRIEIHRQRFKWLMVPNRNLIFAFLFLHIFFISNLLSFGFWKLGTAFLAYSVLYFGTIILGLTLFLWLAVKATQRKKMMGTTLAVLIVFTLPLFGLWMQTLQIQTNLPELFFLVLFPFIACIYYRLTSSNVAGTAIVMLGLSAISFFSHAEFKRSNPISEYQHPKMHLSEIQLSRKPSIHVIKFDSLTTSAFSKEFLDVPNPADDYLSELSDSIYAGNLGFVENIPTRNAWQTLFDLGMQHEKIETSFSGLSPSPLTSLLRENGYKIQTGFSSNYLGHSKGPYIDYYYTRDWRISNTPPCEQRLLGFCSMGSDVIYGKIYAYFKPYKPYAKANATWQEDVVELVKNFETDFDSPVFSAFHVNIPSHTPGYYVTGNKKHFERYKNRFILGTKEVQEILVELNKLRQQFPDSVFIISGDHGPKLSRSLTDDENRRFRVLDFHHVSLTLLNSHNLCPKPKAWLEQQRYLTPSRLISATLACDEDSLAILENFKDNLEFFEFGPSL